MSTGAPAGPPGRPYSTNGVGQGGGPRNTNGVAQFADGSLKNANRIFPHIDDLVSAKPDVNIHAPIRRLLLEGDTYAKQADTQLDFRRPDLALQEYIKASIIAVDIIPRHKEFPELKSDRGDLHRLYGGLKKRISSQHAQFEDVKKRIQENNLASGVRPTSRGQWSGDKAIVGDYSVKSRPLPLQSDASDHSNATQNGQLEQTHSMALSSNSAGDAPKPRTKPPVQPKPDSLHGNAISPIPTTSISSVANEDLAARFARLRGTEVPALPPVQDSRIRTRPISTQGDSTQQNRIATSSMISPTRADSTQQRLDRPLGPREMPQVPQGSPKMPNAATGAAFPTLPRPPDAIYSPSRGSNDQLNKGLSRPNLRTQYSSTGRLGSTVNASGPRSFAGAYDGSRNMAEYTSAAHSIPGGPSPKKFAGIDLPNSSTVTAEDLLEYLKRGSQELKLLLVDIRHREHFDSGHILSHSIICVEPIVLRESMSADELNQSLVLSPDAEQKLFDKRHEFDLVVYYDQSSSSNRYSGPTSSVDEIPLRDFSKAVYDYGYEKQLRRPPMLLLGGLDAWIDLVGQGALEVSKVATAPSVPARRDFPSAHASHNSVTSQYSRKPPARRKTYESRPLTQDEEAKWAEKLKVEPESFSSKETREGIEVSYIKTQEDFFRRFPDPSALQESMVSPSSSFRAETHNQQPTLASDLQSRLGNQYRDELNSLMIKTPARPPPAVPKHSHGSVSDPSVDATDTPWSLPRIQSNTISNEIVIRGRTGLSNFGNTCYLNAVVQALSATRWLPPYLLGGPFDDSGPPPQKEGETSVPPQLMARNLAWLLRNLWSGQYVFVTPKTLRNYIFRVHNRDHSRNDSYGGTEQQDAHDLLIFFLEILEDETNVRRDQKANASLTVAQERTLRSLPLLKASMFMWNRFLRNTDSPIGRRFRGQMSKELRCTCGQVSRAWDDWLTLHVNLDKDKSRQTLDDALSQTFKTEEVPDYTCEKCKLKGNTKQLVGISRLPGTLVLHLVRHTLNAAGMAAKIRSVITFPVNGLDMSPHFIPHEAGKTVESLEAECAPPFVYDCYAVIQHAGDSPRGGHYWSIVRDVQKSPRTWVEFNDRRTSEVSESKLQHDTTYMLFYQRRF